MTALVVQLTPGSEARVTMAWAVEVTLDSEGRRMLALVGHAMQHMGGRLIRDLEAPLMLVLEVPVTTARVGPLTQAQAAAPAPSSACVQNSTHLVHRGSPASFGLKLLENSM